MAEDLTMKEVIEWAKRCTEYSKITRSREDTEDGIERLGDVDSDWKQTKFTIEHVYLQEPHFSVLDEEFIQSRGYEILHTPESDDYMDESTFLFTPGAEQDVEESSLAAAFPALYIHHDLSPDGYRLWLLSPLGPLVDKKCQKEERLLEKVRFKARNELLNSFVSQRGAIKLPKVPVEEWFFEFTIYYKPDSAEDIPPLALPPKKTPEYTWERAREIWPEKGCLSHLEDSEDDEDPEESEEELEKETAEEKPIIEEEVAARLKDITV